MKKLSDKIPEPPKLIKDGVTYILTGTNATTNKCDVKCLESGKHFLNLSIDRVYPYLIKWWESSKK